MKGVIKGVRKGDDRRGRIKARASVHTKGAITPYTITSIYCNNLITIKHHLFLQFR